MIVEFCGIFFNLQVVLFFLKFFSFVSLLPFYSSSSSSSSSKTLLNIEIQIGAVEAVETWTSIWKRSNFFPCLKRFKSQNNQRNGQTSYAGSRFTNHSITFRFSTSGSVKLCDRYTILKFPNKCKSSNLIPMVEISSADKIPIYLKILFINVSTDLFLSVLLQFFFVLRSPLT